jgi:transcriptional regulator of nitric oxide reductase
MPRDGVDPLAQLFATIPCARVSFELKDEDVQAYRKHVNTLQEAVQLNAAARAQEEEEYLAWRVSPWSLLLHEVQDVCMHAACLLLCTFLAVFLVSYFRWTCAYNMPYLLPAWCFTCLMLGPFTCHT